jgi:hypothetical protein
MTKNDSTALATPVKATPPGRTTSTGGNRGPAQDILAAWEQIKDTRETWYLVAQGVPNPNRYFDAFKALGGKVKQVKVGDKQTDVYVQIPAGGPVPHRKPSQRKGTATSLVEVAA